MRYARRWNNDFITIECDENPSIITPNYAHSVCLNPDKFQRKEVVS